MLTRRSRALLLLAYTAAFSHLHSSLQAFADVSDGTGVVGVITVADISVKVMSPEVTGSGMSKHTTYSVITDTVLPDYPGNTMMVCRR